MFEITPETSLDSIVLRVAGLLDGGRYREEDGLSGMFTGLSDINRKLRDPDTEVTKVTFENLAHFACCLYGAYGTISRARPPAAESFQKAANHKSANIREAFDVVYALMDERPAALSSALCLLHSLINDHPEDVTPDDVEASAKYLIKARSTPYAREARFAAQAVLYSLIKERSALFGEKTQKPGSQTSLAISQDPDLIGLMLEKNKSWFTPPFAKSLVDSMLLASEDDSRFLETFRAFIQERGDLVTPLLAHLQDKATNQIDFAYNNSLAQEMVSQIHTFAPDHTKGTARIICLCAHTDYHNKEEIGADTLSNVKSWIKNEGYFPEALREILRDAKHNEDKKTAAEAKALLKENARLPKTEAALLAPKSNRRFFFMKLLRILCP